MYLPDRLNPALIPEQVKLFIYLLSVVFFVVAIWICFREYKGEDTRV